MSLSDPFIQWTDEGDGSAKFTITIADDDHRFSVSSDGGEAVVEYEETLSWRGKVRVSEPDEIVFKELMQSSEMTDFLDNYGYSHIKRA